MNLIWSIMIVLGILVSFFNGNICEMTDYVITAGKDAVQLAFTMCGIVPVWCGMMKIAEKSGLISALSRQMYPVIGKLFPDIPKNSSALKNITANITANIFGLGWAATPAGINAMKDMSKLNGYKKTASKSMCMIMVINMSSVQLITINIIAYRSQFGSSAPASVIFPGIIATAISTVVGIAAVKAAERLVKI